MSSSARQLERMLALVPYLQANDGIPVQELAERFGVPASKITQEVSRLAMTGTRPNHAEMIDIDYDSLKEGYAYIRNADFMSRPLRLTVLEGASLVAALGVLRHLAEAEQIEIIDRVATKIHSSLSDGTTDGISVHVNTPHEETWSALKAAIRDGKQVEIEYAADHSDSVSTRIIDPVSLEVARGSVYLMAHCHLAGDRRIFRLDRINSLTVLDSSIESQPASQPIELFTFKETGSTAVLEVDPQARWIVEPCQTELISETPEGIQTVQVEVADLQWLQRLVLLSVGAIRVIEPSDFAQQVRAAASSALDAYDRN